MNRHRFEVAFAWTVLTVAIIGWPLSALTWAAQEPQFILGLSWMALILQGLELLKSSRVHRDISEGSSE